MKSISIEAPAKLNLGLQITGMREDGFHSLASHFTKISLSDTLDVTLTSKKNISISCSGIEVPTDKNNIIWKAASLFKKASGYSEGISIHLQKNIPSPGGLGGGSSDAASTLLALRELLNTNLNLFEIAEQLGSDVPFFLLDSTSAFVTGRGEILKAVTLPQFHCILVNSGEQVPTPLAYRLWDQHNKALTDTQVIHNNTAYNFGAWHEGKPFPVKLDNSFFVTLQSSFPGFTGVAEKLSEVTDNWGLSGSGPVFYALFRSSAETEKAKKHLSGKFPWMFCCQSR